MSSNHKILYEYHCGTENTWIREEKGYLDSPPTQCKNDAGHTFNSGSLKIVSNHYCHYTDNTNIPESFDLTALDYANLSVDNKKIAQILRSLLKCAELRGLIKFV